MRTKIRLILDLIFQIICLIILALRIHALPLQTFEHLFFFSLTISLWQIPHAMYVVEKHRDWHRTLYLQQIYHVTRFAILGLILLGIATLLSFGILYPYLKNILYFSAMGVGLVLSFLALNCFLRSLLFLRSYRHRHRSFWDSL